MTSKSGKFDALLLDAIDQALASLGESARESIYFHLEKQFKLAKQRIPSSLEEFDGGLQKIFGIGAKYIEILIMKQLYQAIDQPLNWDGKEEFGFIEYVNAAQKTFSHRLNSTDP
jgi:hypothetical protein